MFSKNINRLFTFGCSFTKYYWPLWPEILSYELDIPLYNFGRSGAGNQYIFNMLMQADNIYDFNQNDLVIVSWTNVCREDRITTSRFNKTNHNWQTPGNIFSQQIYDQSFVKRWGSPFWFSIRDFATIKSAYYFLEHKKCQFSMISMCNIAQSLDQWNPSLKTDNTINNISTMYLDVLSKINKSFYEVLWNNDIGVKCQLEKETIHPQFHDGHPSPLECYTYLTKIYDYQFNESTLNIVNKIQDIYHKNMIEFCSNSKNNHTTYPYPTFNTEEVIDFRIFR